MENTLFSSALSPRQLMALAAKETCAKNHDQEFRCLPPFLIHFSIRLSLAFDFYTIL